MTQHTPHSLHSIQWTPHHGTHRTRFGQGVKDSWRVLKTASGGEHNGENQSGGGGSPGVWLAEEEERFGWTVWALELDGFVSDEGGGGGGGDGESGALDRLPHVAAQLDLLTSSLERLMPMTWLRQTAEGGTAV